MSLLLYTSSVERSRLEPSPASLNLLRPYLALHAEARLPEENSHCEPQGKLRAHDESGNGVCRKALHQLNHARKPGKLSRKH